MALESKTIPTEAAANTLFNREKRIKSDYDLTVTFGTDSGESTLATLTPVGLNKSTGKWGKWMAPDATVLEVDTGGATGGTWGLTVNNQAIANTTLAYNATAAVVTAAIKAIGYDVTVALAAGVYTITFDGTPEVETLPTVSGDVTQLTGGTDEAATATAGTATNGLQEVRGFVYPESITLDDTNDVLGVVSVKGEYFYDDIEDNVDSGDQTALKTALKDAMIAKGIIIQGLPGIA